MFGGRRRQSIPVAIPVATHVTLMLLVLLLAACTAPQDVLRAVGYSDAKVGGVSADEPRAAIVARDVLSIGGNAMDAAVALYFTSAVTFPATASLGAGGVCLVFDADAERVESLLFPAVPPPSADADTRLKIAIPGAVRGMFALHARYGKLNWSQLLAPAEQLARLGHPMSRAMARDLARVAAPLFNSPAMAAIFGREDGTPLDEGELLVQLELAGIISQLRTRGPGSFYSGVLARNLVRSVSAGGGSLTMDDLRGYQPEWRETLQIPYGVNVIHTVPPPLPGGVGLLQMWSMLQLDDRYADADAGERRHLLAEVSMRAFADRAAWQTPGAALGNGASLIADDRIERLMASYKPDRHTPASALNPPPAKRRESPSGTSFTVVDGIGNAVTCSLTLNNFFGRGWMAPGTGIVMAAARPAERGAISAMAPVMIVNPNTGNFFLAAAASGGAVAPSALLGVMARTLIDGEPLASAIQAPRIYQGGNPDLVVYEPGEPAESIDRLRRRGHKLAQAPALGRVNAIYCREGIQENPAGCSVNVDPRGFGLASFVQLE